MRRMSFVVLALVLGGGCTIPLANSTPEPAIPAAPAASSPAGEARKPQEVPG